MYQQQPGQHHHVRFYVIMITLVILGIFFLLLANDSQNFSLTSAMIGVVNDSSVPAAELEDQNQEDSEEEPEVAEGFGTEFNKKAPRKTAGKNFKEVSFLLFYSQIPSISQETGVGEIVLEFDDLSTNINVNGDRLELNNLQEVVLQIRDFEGKIEFDRQAFSLDGSAKGLAINNIALSSTSEIEISFENLEYSFLSLDDIELTMLKLPRGNGEVTVGEKLTYGLEQDVLEMYYFNGLVIADFEAESMLQMEGIARGIGISGAILNFNIQ